MNSSESSAGLRAWVLALAVAGFVGWVLACVLNSVRSEVADDAFITYTYARNLAEGFGLRFNPGDAAPTWGASSLLHTLYAAAAVRLDVHPLIATRALSLATFLLLGGAFGWTAARLTRCSTPAAVIAGLTVCGLWGLSPESSTHMVSGMDALLFTLVHGLSACWAALAVARPSRLTSIAGWIVLTSMVLARPEGMLLAVAYVLAVAFARRSEHGTLAALREHAPLATALLLGVLALVGWRWSYFGQLHPNAYYVKVDSALFGSAGAPLPGVETTARFLLVRWLPMFALAAALAAAVRASWSLVASSAALLAPSVLVVLSYSRAIHEMANGFRYEYPMLAPLVLALVVGLGALQRRSPLQFATTLVLGGLALPLLAGPSSPRLLVWLRHPRSLATAWMRNVPTDNALARLGLDLADTGLEQRATILLSGAGQAPYHSRWRAIDWIGLNDARFSGREPLSVERMWEQIDQLAPDVCFSILPPAAPGTTQPNFDPNWKSPAVQESLRGRGSALFKHWNPTRLAESFWREMVWIRDHCEFGAAYKLGPAWGADWWVLVYVRRDSPHRERVLEVLRNSKRADRESDLAKIFPFDPRSLGATN